MFPILNPPPSSLPIPSLWVVPYLNFKKKKICKVKSYLFTALFPKNGDFFPPQRKERDHLPCFTKFFFLDLTLQTKKGYLMAARMKAPQVQTQNN